LRSRSCSLSWRALRYPTIDQIPYSYRSDPRVPGFADDRPVIVFDGYCVLCSGWAKFVIRHDRAGKYRLLAAQSPLGRALYEHYALNPDRQETNILIADGRAWFKSEGSIRMFEGLGLPWSLLRVFRIIPEASRDAAYGWVAGNRFRWFGTRASCFVPTPDIKERFL
jgi:predicted DCC family thiol-disulfide oxidoreductase YuxK